MASDCPTNPIVIQDSIIGNPLNWTEPTFTDNAGSLARVTVNRSPGVKLSYYGKINIKYIAQDASGNMGICEFVLIPTVGKYPECLGCAFVTLSNSLVFIHYHLRSFEFVNVLFGIR